MTLTCDDIQTQIIEMLGRRLPPDTPVTSQTQIVGGLGLDSVEVLDFIMDVEDRFDISIPLDRVTDVRTIGELSRAIESLKRAVV